VRTWWGIELTEDGCHVNRINLRIDGFTGNNLTGTLPPEMGNFPELTHLYLTNNNLSGQLPAEMSGLVNLNVFVIERNQITGPVPPWLGSLSKLEEITLDDNPFTAGSIPVELFNLAQLRWLGLRNCGRTGILSGDLARLQNLEVLELGSNQLSGPIPPEISQLSKLQVINLYENKFTGSIPASIRNLSQLEWLHLYDNQLSGNIPDFSSSATLAHIRVENNCFLFGGIDAANVSAGVIEFIYAPQDTILALNELYESRQLTIIDDDFAGNIYHWYLNDALYKEGNDVLDLSETGMYYCLVTHPDFPELTLYSDTLYIEVIMPHYDDLVPVNLVIIDGAHPPQFLIPGIDLYPDNSLVLFTRWGKKVYERSGYNNDLDFSEYPEGTYYYVLNYVKPDGSKQIKSFVDVVKQ